MTLQRVAAAAARLQPGLTEMYFHPATQRDEVLTRLMPDYQHVAEYQALLTARLDPSIHLTTFGASQVSR